MDDTDCLGLSPSTWCVLLDVELHSYPCQCLCLHLLASPAGFAFLGVAVVFDMYVSVSAVSSQSVAIFSITKDRSVPRGLGVSLVLSQACLPCSLVPLVWSLCSSWARGPSCSCPSV